MKKIILHYVQLLKLRVCSVFIVSLTTVMIRFSAQGAYLLLVPQGRAFIRDRALIRDRSLISFLRNNQMFKTKFEEEIIRLKELCTHMDITVGKLKQRLFSRMWHHRCEQLRKTNLC